MVVTVIHVLLFVLHVCMMREGDGNAGVGIGEVWLWLVQGCGCYT